MEEGIRGTIRSRLESRYAEVRSRLWGKPPAAELIRANIPDPTDYRYILKSVAIKHKISEMHLRAGGKHASIPAQKARDEACWRLYYEGRQAGLRFSTPDIGKLMDRHHTSVLASIKKHQRRLDAAK